MQNIITPSHGTRQERPDLAVILMFFSGRVSVLLQEQDACHYVVFRSVFAIGPAYIIVIIFAHKIHDKNSTYLPLVIF